MSLLLSSHQEQAFRGFQGQMLVPTMFQLQLLLAPGASISVQCDTVSWGVVASTKDDLVASCGGGRVEPPQVWCALDLMWTGVGSGGVKQLCGEVTCSTRHQGGEDRKADSLRPVRRPLPGLTLD